ncbi:MAG TPA: NAD(P)/FAD-dependent oxidoreductase, partial [Solirubrobacterales bacterium]|nr:NAD(P)/FAD-dependent oxidoreductase [Solirubrobacterales bacterium]
LYFIGFIQPLGPIMPLAEAQSEWIADLLAGRTLLPAAAEMRREIEAEEARQAKRFVASKRHTVEVDFYPYLREIRRERKRAAAPA